MFQQKKLFQLKTVSYVMCFPTWSTQVRVYSLLYIDLETSYNYL